MIEPMTTFSSPSPSLRAHSAHATGPPPTARGVHDPVHHNVGRRIHPAKASSFLDEVLGDYDPSTSTSTTPKPAQGVVDEGNCWRQIRDADLIIRLARPVYWNIGPHTSYNVGWAKELWFDRIFQLGPASRSSTSAPARARG